MLQHISKEDQEKIMNSPLWTTQALYDHPRAVISMYQAYIEAGADLISCMTYQQSAITMSHMSNASVLYDQGMAIALQAAHKTAVKPVLCLGNYAAMLSNGAEYNHKFLDTDKAMLKKFHRERLETFIAQDSWACIDYIAFETIPDVLEAEIILQVLAEMPAASRMQEKRIWLSFACSEMISPAKVLHGIDAVLENDHLRRASIWGLGVNCFKKELLSTLVRPLCARLQTTALHAIIYPDAGRDWDPIARTFSGPATDPVRWAEDLGSIAGENHGRIVLGGCCQTGPEHIRALKSCLKRRK